MASAGTAIVSVNRLNGQSIVVEGGGMITQPLPSPPEGLTNGNPVYSDQTYTWVNTPVEFAGSEYIRTFDIDKRWGRRM